MNNEILKRDLASRLMDGVVCKTPYGIMQLTQVELNNKPYIYWFGYDNKIKSKHFNAEICILKGIVSKGFYSNKIKPYLFQTSALTKPIRLANYNNGEPFVPMDMIRINVYYPDWDKYLSSNLIYLLNELRLGGRHEQLPVWLINLFNQWHINYRLSPDQFIEVTEENNPYI